MAEASLNDIYQRLNGTERYHPMNASTHADWSLEAGDVVTVSRDGESFSAPVHSSTLQWNGKQKIDIESGGDRTRGPVAKMSARQYNTGNGGGNGCRGGRRQAEEDKKFWSEFDKQDEYIRMTVYNFEDENRKLESQIKVQKDRIDMTVKAIGNDNGEINAGTICLAINKDNSTEAIIDADKVYIGNQKSTTVINGKLDAKDVTAEYLNAKIATIPTLNGISARFSGNVSAAGAIMGSGVYIGSGTSYKSLSEAVQGVQIIPSGNNYILQQKKFSDSSWQNISNFSRAITSWSGRWVGGAYEVTAQPQNQKHTSPALDGYEQKSKQWSSDYKSCTLGITVYDTKGTNVFTDTMLVNTSDSWSAGGSITSVTAPQSSQSQFTVTATSHAGKTGTKTYYLTKSGDYIEVHEGSQTGTRVARRSIT